MARSVRCLVLLSASHQMGDKRYFKRDIFVGHGFEQSPNIKQLHLLLLRRRIYMWYINSHCSDLVGVEILERYKSE